MNGTIGRLQEVLDQVGDPDIKAIVDGAFKVEISYRSMEAKNFPRQKVRDIIEDTARLIESRKSPTANETAKN